MSCVSENGRTIAGTVKGKKMMRVSISDGRGEPLKGRCVFFLREKRDEINNQNYTVCPISDLLTMLLLNQL